MMDVGDVIENVKTRHEERLRHRGADDVVGDAEADIQTLLRAVSALQKVVSDNKKECLSDARAVDILLSDIRRRELAVQQREERVWGWRILVADKDDALREEILTIEARERELRQAEVAFRDREMQLVLREKAVEQKLLLMREDFNFQTKSMKALLQRAESKAS